MPEKKQTEPTSRTERRELQKEKQNQEKAQKKASNKTKEVKQQDEQKPKRYRRRIFPIWLRIIVVLVICALALLAGVMIGYGIIGDGNPSDALKLETWQHIIDIVTKNE